MAATCELTIRCTKSGLSPQFASDDEPHFLLAEIAAKQMRKQKSVPLVDGNGAEGGQRHGEIDFAGLQGTRMIGERNVGNLHVLFGINRQRLQEDRQLSMLQGAGWHSNRHRLAGLSARGDEGLQGRWLSRRDLQAFARDQHIVAAAPPRDPSDRNALTDGANEMLCGGVADLQLALLKRQQHGGAVAKILVIVFDILLGRGLRQGGAQGAEGADLQAMTYRVCGQGRRRNRHGRDGGKRRHGQSQLPAGHCII